MVIQGAWSIIAGISALSKHGGLFVVTASWIFEFDIPTWGWIFLLLGLVLLFTGVGILRGKFWARVLGVWIAAVTAIAAFAWLPYFPIWAVMLTVASVAVIWALFVHGNEMADA